MNTRLKSLKEMYSAISKLKGILVFANGLLTTD